MDEELPKLRGGLSCCLSILVRFVETCASLVQVCPVEGQWVNTVLPKLRGVDVKRLSGGATAAAAKAEASQPAGARGRSAQCLLSVQFLQGWQFSNVQPAAAAHNVFH